MLHRFDTKLCTCVIKLKSLLAVMYDVSGGDLQTTVQEWNNQFLLMLNPDPAVCNLL